MFVEFDEFDDNGARRKAIVRADPLNSPSCALNVTPSINVTPGSLRRDRRTGRYTQRVTLRNTSGADISGPLSFVLDSLTDGATLFNAVGVASCATPSGSPYVDVDVGSDSIFSPRERTSGTLEFTLEFVSPGDVAYTPRILTGPGGR